MILAVLYLDGNTPCLNKRLITYENTYRTYIQQRILGVLVELHQDAHLLALIV